MAESSETLTLTPTRTAHRVDVHIPCPSCGQAMQLDELVYVHTNRDFAFYVACLGCREAVRIELVFPIQHERR
jgi:hypothetical protein